MSEPGDDHMGFMDKVKDSVKNADEKLGNAIDKEKLDSQVRDQEREIEKITAEIGKKVVEALKKDEAVTAEAFSEDMQKIKDCEAKIEELKQKKAEIEGKKN